jgi:tetratricopeptide (TPR) repeat protein
MRKSHLVALFCLGLWVPSLDAGLYNPAEPAEGKLDPNFEKFRTTLIMLRSIPADKVVVDNPLRIRYRLFTDLAPRSLPATWTTTQRLSMSAYLIRRQKHLEAIEILTLVAARERSNFLVSSNLATAYQLSGQDPRRAIEFLEQTLASWPRSWKNLDKGMQALLAEMGWQEGSLDRFREAEKYQKDLLRMRLKAGDDLRGGPGPRGLPKNVDDLFGVTFVGESGKYEAGNLAAGQKAKLPPNALAIVQQLLVWLPDDLRLYWLLGELYNARGSPRDVKAAVEIFNTLAVGASSSDGFNSPFRVPLLVEHLKVLRAAPTAEPNPGDLEKPSPGNQTDKPAPPAPALLDWRSLLAGFVAGALVSLFAYWQVREIRRRRQRPATGGEK